MHPQMPKWMASNPVIRLRQQILKSGEFALLDNDEDRIKFTVDGLIEYGWELEKYTNKIKNSVTSENYRKQGNTAFASNPSTSVDLEAALELYSKSVAYALPGSRELSLAYGNRSAVLFEARRYEECLLDIGRALDTGYPDDLKPKLLIRKAKCVYALTGNMSTEVDETLLQTRLLIEKLSPKDKYRQKLEDILNNPDNVSSIGKVVRNSGPEFMPQLEKENPKFPGASDAVKLEFSEKYGVHVVAARNIQSGEVLMLQKPYVTVVANESWYDLCAYCGKRSWNGIPCDYCVSVLYCSDECKHAAWSEYHDIECQMSGTMMELNHHFIMSLRLTIKALKEARSFEKLKLHLDELDSSKGEKSPLDISLDPTSYATIYTMLDNPSDQLPEELIHWASNAIDITYFLATRTDIFGNRLTRDLKVVKDAEWFTFTAALMSKHMRIAKSRANGMTATKQNGEKVQKILTLLPVYTFLNHSCCLPSTLYSFPEAMTLITPVPVNKGDQVFTCYGPYFMKMEKALRIQELKTHYHFVCDCPACKYDWCPSTYTSHKDQRLPGQALAKLHEAKKILAEYSEQVARSESIDRKRYSNEICAIIDVIYPLIRYRLIVQPLVGFLHDIFSALSHPYPPLAELA